MQLLWTLAAAAQLLFVRTVTAQGNRASINNGYLTDKTRKHQQQPQLNVLYIIVDDLRPEFADAYNQTYMKTPNLDKLAETGLTFDRAYCQQAVCGPTRNRFVGFHALH